MSLIERDLAIRAIAEDMLEMAITENPDTGDTVGDWMLTAESILSGVPDAEPEITDEQAILHLQSTGWMQRHDKAMYEHGLKTQLADDRNSYDSLIPSFARSEPISEAYAKAVFTWLLDYQIKTAELKGRYTPYEVLSWVANDWRKEHERSD